MLRDFWDWVNRTGPYAPKPRNPQTIETAEMPAALKRMHGWRAPGFSWKAAALTVILLLAFGAALYASQFHTTAFYRFCDRARASQVAAPGCLPPKPTKTKGK